MCMEHELGVPSTRGPLDFAYPIATPLLLPRYNTFTVRCGRFHPLCTPQRSIV